MYQTWAYVTNMSGDTEETMVEVTQEFIIKYFRKGSTIHTPTFLLYVWTLLWKRGRSVLETLIQAGPLFAKTMAASAILSVPIAGPPTTPFSPLLFLSLKKKCIFKNKIGIKYYIRLSYTTQQFNICTYFEMVTTLSQHPSLNVDTESFFLIRWSFKIYSFPSVFK